MSLTKPCPGKPSPFLKVPLKRMLRLLVVPRGVPVLLSLLLSLTAKYGFRDPTSVKMPSWNPVTGFGAKSNLLSLDRVSL